MLRKFIEKPVRFTLTEELVMRFFLALLIIVILIFLIQRLCEFKVKRSILINKLIRAAANNSLSVTSRLSVIRMLDKKYLHHMSAEQLESFKDVLNNNKDVLWPKSPGVFDSELYSLERHIDRKLLSRSTSVKEFK